jgi:hypothetical protein
MGETASRLEATSRATICQLATRPSQHRAVLPTAGHFEIKLHRSRHRIGQFGIHRSYRDLFGGIDANRCLAILFERRW